MAEVTETLSAHPTSYDTTNISYYSVNTSYPLTNGYTDSNSTTYAQVHLTRNSEAETYVYYKFNFNDIPDDATISTITAKAKGYVNNTSSTRVNVRQMQLCTGFSSNITFKGTALTISNSATEQTFSSVGSWTVSEIKDSGIRFYCKRGTSNTTTNYYMRMYGATMTVTYTYNSITYTVTSSLSGIGTIDPSGAEEYSPGDTYLLTIVPDNPTDTISATKNGTSITSSLVVHPEGSDTLNTVLGEYTLVSGGFNGSGATYFSGIVGNGSSATQTTSNYYSSGNGTIAVFTYDMGITIPSVATIERVWCEVNGHAESTSQSSEYMCAMLISGNTELTEELNFKSVGTSNSTQTLECETLPTTAQLKEMKLQCRLGYYGGAINGATVYVTYTMPTYYTYTYSVDGDATIVVVITSGGSTATLYVKENGTWTTYSKVYVKVNGSWVEQASSSWATLFNTSTNYVKG